MTEVEKEAWNAFVEVTKNFLGNSKSENYIELVNDMLNTLHKLNINMSTKVHFLFSHLERFPKVLLFSILFPIVFNCVLLFSKVGRRKFKGRKLKGAKIEGSEN